MDRALERVEQCVGVSAFTGAGMPEFFTAVDAAVQEYHRCERALGRPARLRWPDRGRCGCDISGCASPLGPDSEFVPEMERLRALRVRAERAR